jgi:anti-sigma factor RsiW
MIGERGAGAVVSEAELGAFCDGELDDAAAARVEAALQADPALRAEMARLMRERAALSGDAEVREAPDPAVAALASRLEARLRGRRRRRLAAFAAGVVAAVAAIAAGGWFAHDAAVTRQVVPASEAPRFVEEAAGAHAIFAPDDVHPVEFFSSDEELMRQWFEGHLDHVVRIPHIEDLGFELIGGRLLGGAQGATAQLMYENAKGDRVSVVFGRHEAPQDGTLHLVRLGDVYASWWKAGDLAWAVLESGAGADVSAVATRVAALSRRTAAEN